MSQMSYIVYEVVCSLLLQNFSVIVKYVFRDSFKIQRKLSESFDLFTSFLCPLLLPYEFTIGCYGCIYF